jgi:hypothetical protein
MDCFFSESRMQRINATGLNGKSGGAQWRDLRYILSAPWCTLPMPSALESLSLDLPHSMVSSTSRLATTPGKPKTCFLHRPAAWSNVFLAYSQKL